MQAITFYDILNYSSEVEKPTIENGWAIVKVLKAGICNTDLEIIKGYMGFKGILGHEFIGIVEECRDTKWIGKRVSTEINFACNNCDWCDKKLQRHCPNRSTLGIYNVDGCMADYCKVPINCLVEIPTSTPDNKAIFLEPLSAACEIIEQLSTTITGEEKVIVLGDGKLGILCSWVLSTIFKDTTLIGHHSDKLKLASWNNLKTAISLKNIPGADIVIEATGSVSGINTAIDMCKPRGKVVLKSTVADQMSVNMTKVVVDEISIIGSRCGVFKDGLKIMKDFSDIPLERLITEIYPAYKSIEAFNRAAQKGVLKVIIDFQS